MNQTPKADQTFAVGDLCLVIRIPGFYCHGFGPGTVVTLVGLEIFNFELRWRCTNPAAETAWAVPHCLRKLPPDQWKAADWDWRELTERREIAA
jgi:hypothetical protein